VRSCLPGTSPCAPTRALVIVRSVSPKPQAPIPYNDLLPDKPKEPPLPQDWESDAVRQELTERISQGDFSGDFEAIKAAIDGAGLLTEREQQQLLQYWLSKEREAGRGK